MVFPISVKVANGTAVLRLVDPLGRDTWGIHQREVLHAIDQILQDSSVIAIEIELGSTARLDSMSCGTLFAAHHKAKTAGINIGFTQLSDQCLADLKQLNFDKVLNLR